MTKHGRRSKKQGIGIVGAITRGGGGGAKVALLVLAMAATASVALVRACERKAGPMEDDAAAADSCSGDAAFCVA